MEKKLMRSNDRVLAGVCGGLAEYFDFDPVLVRVAYAFLTFFISTFFFSAYSFKSIDHSAMPSSQILNRPKHLPNSTSMSNSIKMLI